MKTWTKAELAHVFDVDWFDFQDEVLDGEVSTSPAQLRACLYYRTGAGKTITALALLAQAGVGEAVVVAPPATHGQWREKADLIGLKLQLISHAKYRQPGVKFARTLPIVVDEFHLFGGQTGAGWSKFRVHARHIQAPLIILSATPNYNDAERVYCVEQVLDPSASKGGYLGWIQAHCLTEVNPFGSLPIVLGFNDGRSARDHLASLTHTYHVPDPNENFPIEEVILSVETPAELEELGLDRRGGRIVASRMEYESARRKAQLIAEDGLLHGDVVRQVLDLCTANQPVLIFCARATIANAAAAGIADYGWMVDLITGNTHTKLRDRALTRFKRGELDVLVGTATMATGVDGLDKACDMLILLDDTDDASLRRQVIGRILPRGDSNEIHKKRVIRLVRP